MGSAHVFNANPGSAWVLHMSNQKTPKGSSLRRGLSKRCCFNTTCGNISPERANKNGNEPRIRLSGKACMAGEEGTGFSLLRICDHLGASAGTIHFSGWFTNPQGTSKLFTGSPYCGWMKSCSPKCQQTMVPYGFKVVQEFDHPQRFDTCWVPAST